MRFALTSALVEALVALAALEKVMGWPFCSAKAMQACEPLASGGDAKAQHHMAQLALMRNDLTQAAEWATRSAQQRYAPGQLVLGQLYQEGRGVTRDPIRATG